MSRPPDSSPRTVRCSSAAPTRPPVEVTRTTMPPAEGAMPASDTAVRPLAGTTSSLNEAESTGPFSVQTRTPDLRRRRRRRSRASGRWSGRSRWRRRRTRRRSRARCRRWRSGPPRHRAVTWSSCAAASAPALRGRGRAERARRGAALHLAAAERRRSSASCRRRSRRRGRACRSRSARSRRRVGADRDRRARAEERLGRRGRCRDLRLVDDAERGQLARRSPAASTPRDDERGGADDATVHRHEPTSSVCRVSTVCSSRAIACSGRADDDLGAAARSMRTSAFGARSACSGSEAVRDAGGRQREQRGQPEHDRLDRGARRRRAGCRCSTVRVRSRIGPVVFRSSKR